MSPVTKPALSPASSERVEFVESDKTLAPRRRRRRLVTAAVVLALAGAAGGYVEWAKPGGISISHPFGAGHHSGAARPDNTAATATQAVIRRSLSETTSVSGAVGYAGDYTVLGQLRGTITWLPKPGQVIHQGRPLYRVDGHPVVLLYGATPAYRMLAERATAAGLTGRDVAQLNHDLVALGYLNRFDVDAAWNQFNWATKAGVKRLQRHLGVDRTGQLELGRVVFLPSAARVATVHATLGGTAGGPIMTATSTARQVSVDLDTSLQAQIHRGDTVTLTLPDNSTTPGAVSSVGRVATPAPSGPSGSNSTPTIPVQITPTRPADIGRLDHAPVQVAITTRTVHNVLAVPVTALLAQSDGGYAVEIATGDGTTRHLVSVSLGLFDNAAGLVQVTGSGLAAGQHVVVPAS